MRDPDARPILQRLLQYPAVRGDCVGAFGECSRDLHSLLHDTVHSAAERHWREAGATSARAAVSVYTAIYRRRWGCETALQGARLRLSRAYLAAGGDARHARGATRPSDPRSTREMLTISRPPPRRCSAACLPGSATRRLCIFFAYRWLPIDHAPCLCPVSCS